MSKLNINEVVLRSPNGLVEKSLSMGDVEIARTYHRWSYTPLDDLSEMPQEVKDIAKIVFTKGVVNEYKKSLKSE